MISLFFPSKSESKDVRNLALGLWISQLLRRDGARARYRDVLPEAIALREAARGANGPAQLSAYLDTTASVTFRPVYAKKTTGWILHRSFRTRMDPRQISLGRLMRDNAIQHNNAKRLRLLTAQISAAKSASRMTAMPNREYDWHTEAVKMFTTPPILPSPKRRWYQYFLQPRTATEHFTHALVTTLHRSTELTTFLTKTGQALPDSSFVTTHFTDIIALAPRQPERAALELLIHIHKALHLYDSESLKAALSISQELLLAPQFNAALATVAATWREKNAPPYHIETLTLLLEGTGWQWAMPLSEEDDGTWALEKISWVQRMINAVDASVVPRPDYWVVWGKVPYAWLGRLSAQNLTLVSQGQSSFSTLQAAQINRLRPDHTTTRIDSGRNLLLPPYSAAEDALSKRTARLSQLLTSAVSQLVGPDLTQNWFTTLDLVVDDLLFASTREFWSLLHHLRQHPAASKGIFCATSDISGAFEAGLEALGNNEQITLIEPTSDITADIKNLRPITHLYTLLHSHLTYPEESNLRQDVKRIIMETSISAGPNNAALLIGRRFDRNYETDLTALGNSIQDKSRAVIFMPTAVGGIKGQLTGLFEDEKAIWYNSTFNKAAKTLWVAPPIARAFAKKGILSSLLEHLHKRDALDLLDLALLLAAHQQLEKFYAEKFLRYIKVGAMVSRYISTTRPAYLALMPGRDFIARVAALAARSNQIASFDVQTVFVGARSRYKPTVADVQLTIETESQKLFQSYFELTPAQTILSGCSKVGIVRQQAQGLNKDAVRRLADLGDCFHLVFAGSPFLESDQPILAALALGLTRWPNTCLGIRLHPTAPQEFTDYCTQLAQNHANIAILTQLSLPQTLVSADILITRFSNVGLEAGLLNRDVIACNFGEDPAPIQLDAMGVASPATNAADLLACIEDFRCHGPRWDNLQSTRSDYRQNNPQLFVDSSADFMRDLMEKFVATGSPYQLFDPTV